jgi:O-methyltransferase involved in polyketide biosynthesis
LAPLQASLFLTLCGRALDSRSPHPVLADRTADEIASRIGYDCSQFPLPASSVTDIALRAKKLDDVVHRFLMCHPDAVVLDLGAGLDNRAARVGPPTDVDWYDIDFPDVAALREQVITLPANVHAIGADLADLGWLDDVPTDRPAAIVADGLVAFLAQETFASLLRRLIEHFPYGEIAFNGYTRFHTWALKHYRGTASIADVVRNPGFDDPHEPERWVSGLRLTEEILLTRVPEVAAFPTGIRWLTRVAALSTTVSRRGTTVLRYSFGK